MYRIRLYNLNEYLGSCSIEDDFKIRDKVRILNDTNIFDKKTLTPSYSKTIYEIFRKEGNRYVLQSLDTRKNLRKTYLPSQMIKTNAKDRFELKKEIELEEHKKKDQLKRKNVKSGLDVNKEGKIEAPKRYKTTSKRKIKLPPKFNKFIVSFN